MNILYMGVYLPRYTAFSINSPPRNEDKLNESNGRRHAAIKIAMEEGEIKYWTLSAFLVLCLIPAILVPQMSFIPPRPPVPEWKEEVCIGNNIYYKLLVINNVERPGRPGDATINGAAFRWGVSRDGFPSTLGLHAGIKIWAILQLHHDRYDESRN